jgi:hypothetical protein
MHVFHLACRVRPNSLLRFSCLWALAASVTIAPQVTYARCDLVTPEHEWLVDAASNPTVLANNRLTHQGFTRPSKLLKSAAEHVRVHELGAEREVKVGGLIARFSSGAPHMPVIHIPRERPLILKQTLLFGSVGKRQMESGSPGFDFDINDQSFTAFRFYAGQDRTTDREHWAVFDANKTLCPFYLNPENSSREPSFRVRQVGTLLGFAGLPDEEPLFEIRRRQLPMLFHNLILTGLGGTVDVELRTIQPNGESKLERKVSLDPFATSPLTVGRFTIQFVKVTESALTVKVLKDF